VIALVDYGAGNLTSVARAFTAVGASVKVTRSKGDIVAADAVVIPGVGHFQSTTAIGDALRTALAGAAQQKPVLGICLGLQFLFDGSDESPECKGLGLLRGRSTPLLPSASEKVPHVGWNTIVALRPSRLLDGVAAGTPFYFTHSYAAPVTSACVASTDYTTPFAAVVEEGNVFGTQFHPEKSGEAGLRVIRNFLDVV
jgi:glutamine amidotransferase